MAQYDFGTIDPNTKSGTALASDLNSWRSALHSTHSGSTAPSYLVAGMLWADTTSANYELKMYDGAQWIVIAVIDATNNVARVAVDPAETSYITSTTSGQIRHLIASADIFTIRSTGVQFNIAAPVIADSNNNELISFTTTASAVNQINIANSATANAPIISTVGGDTNIDLLLTAKGTGIVYTYSETAATNTIIDVARLEARSSGTPANGIGVGLLFAAETTANNFEIGARIEAVTTDVTAASEDFDLVFKTMAAGAAAAERMRIGSTGLVNVSSLAIGGTTVTSTAAELNLVDGSVAGTIVNSKAVIYGAAGQVNATTLQIAGTSITSTAAELNLLDGSVAGTVVNSKAVVYGAAGEVFAATATAGTNTTQVATTAFVQTALGGAASYTLLGTINTTSGTSQTLSGLTLTGYTAMVLEFDDVNVNSTLTNFNLRINSTTGPTISENWDGNTTDGWFGIMTIMLSTGVFSSMLAVSATVPTSSLGAVWAGDCNVTTASTSVTIALSNNSFAAGSIRVYGVK